MADTVPVRVGLLWAVMQIIITGSTLDVRKRVGEWCPWCGLESIGNGHASNNTARRGKWPGAHGAVGSPWQVEAHMGWLETHRRSEGWQWSAWCALYMWRFADSPIGRGAFVPYSSVTPAYHSRSKKVIEELKREALLEKEQSNEALAQANAATAQLDQKVRELQEKLERHAVSPSLPRRAVPAAV